MIRRVSHRGESFSLEKDVQRKFPVTQGAELVEENPESTICNTARLNFEFTVRMLREMYFREGKFQTYEWIIKYETQRE